MARLTWPKDLELFAPKTVEIYSDELVKEVIEEFEIPKHAILRFYNAVDLGTRDFQRALDARENRLTVKEAKKRLDRIASLTAEINDLLEEKQPPLWMALRNSEEQLQQELMLKGGGLLVEIGAARRLGGLGEGVSEGFELLTYRDAEAGVRLLHHIAKMAKNDLPKGKAGRPVNLALRIWVHILCSFWARDLGRPLTYDEHCGELLTPVGRFLTALLTPLAPGAVPSLGSALSKKRTEWRILSKN